MTSKPGFAATLLGALLLLELVIISVAFSADDDFVYLFGHRINVVCAARRQFGVPCPTCGLTRGFVLTIHGRVPDAWRLSPAGPLAAIGIFAMGVALLAFAGLEQRRTPAQVARMKRWIQASALAYAGVGVLIWVTSWISVVTRVKWMRG